MKNLNLPAMVLGAYVATQAAPAYAQQIGSVDTTYRLMGANDKIVIEGFDDPKIPGVSCHISRAKTGGVSGSLGLATDPTEASIACRQIGPVNQTLVDKLEDQKGEEIFSEKTSILFKKQHVVRFYDRKRNTLVYLTYSDKLIDGSPKNSLSTVPIMYWNK